MKQMLLYAFCLSANFACNSPGTAEINEDVTKTFFPIEGTIKSELQAIDSLPIAIIRYTQNGEKRDTTIFPKQDMKILVNELTQPDISSPALKKYYKETVFMDNTTNTVTMSYTTERVEQVIRKIEVTINPENQRVKTIYVEKLEKLGDSKVGKKMIWACGKSLQIISLITKNDREETVQTAKYVWGIN